MESNKKVYFASDVHLGHPDIERGREREKLFVQWLDSIKADALEIYLVGDIFDFWYEYKRVVPRGFVRTLGKLAEIVDSGVKVHFFTGNHDIWVYDYLPSEVGVIIHRKPFETDIFGKRFFIAHGDGLGPGDYAYKFLKKIFTNRVLQWFFSRLHPNFALWLAHSWSNSSRDSKGIIANGFQGKDKEILYKYAEELTAKDDYDFIVFGHRHIVANMLLSNNTTKYINLGDWLYNFSYGVFDGDSFQVIKFGKKLISE